MNPIVHEKVLITVKTYPTLSDKYGELVCTAGLREDGSWIRLYPVPFRLEGARYKKYQWIELDVRKREEDFRPESFRPVDINNITYGEALEKWSQRKKIIERGTVYTNRDVLVNLAKQDGISLATFRPYEVKEMIAEPGSRNWDSEKLKTALEAIKQPRLFDDESIAEFRRVFQPAQKIPYDFKYVFTDDAGNTMKLKVEDWELGMLYLNCRRKSTSEEEAVKKTCEKYNSFIGKSDILFFLGTTLAHHNVSRNPFMIIGVYYPPKEQPTLFSKEDFL